MSCGIVGILGILPKTDRYLQGSKIVYSVPPFNENTARDMTNYLWQWLSLVPVGHGLWGWVGVAPHLVRDLQVSHSCPSSLGYGGDLLSCKGFIATSNTIEKFK